MDTPKFKDYIQSLIFVKRLSDGLEDEVNRVAEKFGDEKTAKELIAEDQTLVQFYIPDKALWSEIRKLTSKVGEKLTEAMRAIAEENPFL